METDEADKEKPPRKILGETHFFLKKYS